MTDDKLKKKEKIKTVIKYGFKLIEIVLAIIGLVSTGTYIYENLIVDADIVIGENVSVENNYDNSKHEINNWNVYTPSDSDYIKYTSQEILTVADYLYKSGDYKSVFTLYELSQVKNNTIALCNKAYLYEHGLGVEKNIEKAIDCLKKANTTYSNRYLLSIYLLYFDDKKNECVELIDALARSGDDLTLEYITLQNYGMTLDRFREKYGENSTIKYDLDCFYSWEYVGEEWTKETPTDYPGIKYVFEKTHYGSDSLSESYIGYIYKKYTLENIDLITSEFLKI